MFGISAGQLRHQVTIQQRSTAVGDFGQQSTTWSDVFTTWAKIEPVNANEQFQIAQLQPSVGHRVTVRHKGIFNDPQAAARYRVIFQGRKLNISGCMNLEERGRWSVLMCVEGASND